MEVKIQFLLLQFSLSCFKITPTYYLSKFLCTPYVFNKIVSTGSGIECQTESYEERIEKNLTQSSRQP